MIDFFQERTGQPYPYAKYAQVVVPEFTNLGMENISATTLSDSIIGDAITYLESDNDSLIAHELAHQWFGDLLTCREWAHIWLNEGFASYFDALYTEYDKGDDAFRLKMAGEQRSYMGGDRSVRRAVVETRYHDPDQLFESVTYAKGASVLHALRGLIGDDAWWRGIKSYVAANKLQVVDTDDFKKAMEKASGKDLGWFFDQWVYHAGHPELKASWKYEGDDQTVRVKVEQTQAVDDQTPLFRLPTTLEIADDSGVRTLAVVVDGKTHEFVIPNRSKPKSVRLDPQGWWTKELEFERAPEEWVFLLEHAGDAPGRLEAARAVRRRENDSKAIEALTKAWARETDPNARAEMVRLLAEVGGDKARPALADAVKDKDARVRTAAYRALANLKADDGAEALFRAALGDSKEAYGVRRAALGALAKWKVKDRAELLAKALETPSDHHVLAAAALDGILSGSGPKIRETAVLYSRPGQPAPLRQAAIGALARLAKDDPQVATVLTELAGDKHRNVRRAVWMALLRNDVKSAVPALEAQLKRETTTARPVLEMAISSLKSSGPRPTPPSASPPAATTDSKAEVATMERQAADFELQAKELRNKAEALKLKDERAKLGAAKTGS
jgi:aminopeptidase N